MESVILQAAQQALIVTVLISGPPILAALVVGLILAVIQALTQIQEQTIQMATKIIAIFGVLYFLGYWMATQIARFAHRIFMEFPRWIQ